MLLCVQSGSLWCSPHSRYLVSPVTQALSISSNKRFEILFNPGFSTFHNRGTCKRMEMWAGGKGRIADWKSSTKPQTTMLISSINTSHSRWFLNIGNILYLYYVMCYGFTILCYRINCVFICSTIKSNKNIFFNTSTPLRAYKYLQNYIRGKTIKIIFVYTHKQHINAQPYKYAV